MIVSQGRSTREEPGIYWPQSDYGLSERRKEPERRPYRHRAPQSRHVLIIVVSAAAIGTASVAIGYSAQQESDTARPGTEVPQPAELPTPLNVSTLVLPDGTPPPSSILSEWIAGADVAKCPSDIRAPSPPAVCYESPSVLTARIHASETQIGLHGSHSGPLMSGPWKINGTAVSVAAFGSFSGNDFSYWRNVGHPANCVPGAGVQGHTERFCRWVPTAPGDPVKTTQVIVVAIADGDTTFGRSRE